MKYLALALLTCLLLLSASAPTPAGAATPVSTSTPTLRPIPATPTSASLYLRPTPTMLILPTMDIDMADPHIDPGPGADWSINIWRWANQSHILDYVGTCVLGLYALKGLLSFVQSPSDKT